MTGLGIQGMYLLILIAKEAISDSNFLSLNKMTKYPLEVWQQRKVDLHEYLSANPSATYGECVTAGLRDALSKFYNNGINNARKDVGIEVGGDGQKRGRISSLRDG